MHSRNFLTYGLVCQQRIQSRQEIFAPKESSIRPWLGFLPALQFWKPKFFSHYTSKITIHDHYSYYNKTFFPGQRIVFAPIWKETIQEYLVKRQPAFAPGMLSHFGYIQYRSIKTLLPLFFSSIKETQDSHIRSEIFHERFHHTAREIWLPSEAKEIQKKFSIALSSQEISINPENFFFFPKQRDRYKPLGLSPHFFLMGSKLEHKKNFLQKTNQESRHVLSLQERDALSSFSRLFLNSTSFSKLLETHKENSASFKLWQKESVFSHELRQHISSTMSLFFLSIRDRIRERSEKYKKNSEFITISEKNNLPWSFPTSNFYFKPLQKENIFSLEREKIISATIALFFSSIRDRIEKKSDTKNQEIISITEKNNLPWSSPSSKLLLRETILQLGFENKNNFLREYTQRNIVNALWLSHHPQSFSSFMESVLLSSRMYHKMQEKTMQAAAYPGIPLQGKESFYSIMQFHLGEMASLQKITALHHDAKQNFFYALFRPLETRFGIDTIFHKISSITQPFVSKAQEIKHNEKVQNEEQASSPWFSTFISIPLVHKPPVPTEATIEKEVQHTFYKELSKIQSERTEKPFSSTENTIFTQRPEEASHTYFNNTQINWITERVYKQLEKRLWLEKEVRGGRR